MHKITFTHAFHPNSSFIMLFIKEQLVNAVHFERRDRNLNFDAVINTLNTPKIIIIKTDQFKTLHTEGEGEREKERSWLRF